MKIKIRILQRFYNIDYYNYDIIKDHKKLIFIVDLFSKKLDSLKVINILY